MPYQSLHKLFQYPLVQLIIILGMLAILLAIYFEPNIYWVRLISHYAFYIMLLFLGAGFFFMIIKAKRLMYFSLFGCGLLSLFLKNASNENIVLPSENIEKQTIRVGLFNISNFSEDLNMDMEVIKSSEIDILFIHEVTPEWAKYLEEELREHYSYYQFFTRIDPFGQAIFSNVQMLSADTLFFSFAPVFDKVPVLSSSFYEEGMDTLHCTSIHSLPPTGAQGYQNLGDLLTEVGNRFIADQKTNFVLSYLNVPAWNAEVKNFRYVYDLKDSRRVSKLFKMPLEHIFYSGQVECIEFIEQQCGTNYIGLIGSYQKVNELEIQVD